MIGAFIGWFHRFGHSLIYFYRGCCWVDIHRGLKPLVITCTCGKVFWCAREVLRDQG